MNNININRKIYHKMEFIDIQLIISLSIIGQIYILTSLDIITFYISLELYLIASIILLITKESKKTINIVIIYFLINAISSIIILLAVSLIYINLGVFNFLDISLLDIFRDHKLLNSTININNIYNIMILGVIIKLGAAPFHI
jgi:formate hydrogenlyase subunit 3/multisubunit Na+/H+ antiporter MnhD subunit